MAPFMHGCDKKLILAFNSPELFTHSPNYPELKRRTLSSCLIIFIMSQLLFLSQTYILNYTHMETPSSENSLEGNLFLHIGNRFCVHVSKSKTFYFQFLSEMKQLFAFKARFSGADSKQNEAAPLRAIKILHQKSKSQTT